MKLLNLIAAASLLVACSAPSSPAGQAHTTATAASPRPTVAVLGTKLTATPRPIPKVISTPRPTHTVVKPAVPHTATKASKAPPGTCVVGQPCSLTGLHWTKTVGCTKAWLANQRRTNPAAQCPPGWPLIP